MQQLKTTRVILASQSPRRKELLQGIINTFEVKVKPVEENYPENLSPDGVAEYLSRLKAQEFKEELTENTLVITADTIVCIGNKILGKPKNKQEAFGMLSLLSGKKHQVITGVTLLTSTKEVVFSETTEIEFYPLSDTEINYYIDNYQPFDKAGAYGIQEWIGYIGIKKITGDYYNVMGLPLHRLYRAITTM